MALATRDRVPNGPLRQRFQILQANNGISAADIARELGWIRACGQVDTTRVMRVLGLSKQSCRGVQRIQDFVSYEQAVRLCRALDMDPFEAGV